MKLNLGEGGAKGFLARHCEKMVAGVVGLVAILFIWDGFTEKGLDGKKNPSDLFTQAERAISHVNTIEPATVERIVSKYEFEPDRYLDNVKAGQREASSSNYPLAVPLVQPSQPPHTKRPDPALFPPEALKVFVVTGPMVFGEIDPLKILEDAEAPEPEKAPVRRPRNNRKRPNPNTMGMGMGMGMGSEMMGDSGAGEPDAGDMGMGMMGMGMGMNGGATGAGKIWTLPDLYLGTYKPNVSPSMGMGMETGMDVGAAAATAKTKGFRSVNFVMLSALIPYSKQFEEFENSLQNATGYIAERDRPNYQYVEVERALITPANENLPEDKLTWQSLAGGRKFLESKRKDWFDKVRDPTQPEYLDEFLTYPFPPVPLRDLTKLVVRDELPIKKKQTGKRTQPDEPEVSLDTDAGTATATEEDEDGVRRRRRGGGGMGAGGMGMGTEMGMSEMGMGMGGYGGDMSGGYGSGGMGMATQQVVEHKLIRYFDLDQSALKPGQRFRYRMRLVLEDPNFPYDENLTPNIRTLDEEATKRVVGLMSAEKPGDKRKQWRRVTEWTPATDIITVEKRSALYAGAVDGPEIKTVSLPGTKVAFESSEPTAKFLPVLWDARLASDVPAEMSVTRGSVLNATTSVAVPHPLTSVIKEVKDYKLSTDAVVVDIRGGMPLDGTSGDDALLSPGEFALIDASGQFIVRNELDDMDDYRRFTYYDEKRMAAPAEPSAGEGSDGDFPGMMGGMGMGGMEGLGYGEE